MDELETRLTAAGRSWRDGEPEPPALEPIVAGLRRPVRWSPARLLAGLGSVAVAVVVLVVLSRGSPAGPETSPEPSTSAGSAIWLLTEDSLGSACDLALAQGHLAASSASGLGIASDEVVQPVAWPPGSTAAVAGDRLTLFDATGAAVAREGDLVQFGGGLRRDDAFGVCPASSIVVLVPAVWPSPTTAGPITASGALGEAFRSIGSATALRAVSETRTVFGDLFPTSGATPADTAVWAIVLSGTFPPPSCGGFTATPHACSTEVATSALVVIDATTGALIEAMMPAPGAAPSPASAIDCGPLATDVCAKAVTAAEGTFPATHLPFISVRIAAPSVLMTCPPSGGPPGSHACGVIAIVTTADGAVTVGLVQSGSDWIWSNLIR